MFPSEDTIRIPLNLKWQLPPGRFKELTLAEKLPKTNITTITTTTREVTLGCNVTDRECHEKLRGGATK